MGNKLYVGNLPYSVRDSDLEQAFGQFGSVTSAKVMMERDTGRSKGFGFVEMGSDAEAQAAIQGMNGQPLGGRGIVVNEARPMEPRPPRSGGGFGGGGGGGAGGGVIVLAHKGTYTNTGTVQVNGGAGGAGGAGVGTGETGVSGVELGPQAVTRDSVAPAIARPATLRGFLIKSTVPCTAFIAFALIAVPTFILLLPFVITMPPYILYCIH